MSMTPTTEMLDIFPLVYQVSNESYPQKETQKDRPVAVFEGNQQSIPSGESLILN
jgi:hypothetical protein